ncbi:MAG: FtsW/RodA/SpoVE family cell cycle protein [Phycisphaerales bacterium]
MTTAPSWSETHHTSRRTLNETAPPSVVPRILWWNAAWFSVLAAIALGLLGVAAIHITEDPETGGLWVRQLVFLGAGVVACLLMAIPKARTWRYLSYPIAIGVIALLIFVLIPFVPTEIVRPRNGARRWINLVLFDLQPSELAKIAFVLALASYLRLRKNYRTLVGLLWPFGIMFVPMGLIVVEPDLGTAMLFPAVLFAMLLGAGARLLHLFTIAGLGAAAAVGIAAFCLVAAQPPTPAYPILKEHQVERIQGLVNQVRGDTRQQDTINYQSHKAATLIGAGGFTGLGAERSRVIVKYNKLPEDHNDMIFAVVVNRWGFLGGAIMIGLYLVYLMGFVAVAAVSRNPFGRLVCVGFGAVVAAQVLVNIGMTLGLFPITGMTLPFVSYGGSSLIANFLMVGIVLGVALRPPIYLSRPSFEFDPPRPDQDPLERLR